MFYNNLYIQGPRQNIKCEREELLMILRSYQIHPGDYDSIVEEMRENRSHLPGKAAEYYAETPIKKL